MFNDYDAAAVRWGIDTALGWFADRAAWQRLTQNAMAEDFSWGRQSLQYERLYRDAMSRPPNKA
jgi:glycogen synthase